MTTLEEARARRQRAEDELTQAREECAEVIRFAAEAGVSQAHIAQQVGYTREHVWRIVHNRAK